DWCLNAYDVRLTESGWCTDSPTYADLAALELLQYPAAADPGTFLWTNKGGKYLGWEVVQGAGHFVGQDQPSAMTAALKRFLAKL
ncbi:hypothetical protein HK405_014648, partial [Cladochytrium tenue]